MCTAAKSTIVFAIGSTLRGDDGVAWRIGEVLEADPNYSELQVVFTELLLPEHAAPLSATEVALFVDCSAITRLGVVSTIELHPAKELPRIFTHHLDPASLLKLTQDLYGIVPLHAFAITVGGESFELSEGIQGDLSKCVEAAIPAAIEAIRASLVCV
jgi:hydrogenase maturation protease